MDDSNSYLGMEKSCFILKDKKGGIEKFLLFEQEIGEIIMKIMNNTFNLAYEVLGWKVHKALVRAKLEPYLGFLHSNKMIKRSLICDSQELYRHLIDDFMIGYCQRINKRDFTVKSRAHKCSLIEYARF